MTDQPQTLILLLSGDTTERLALRKTLRELGWRVMLAGDAASANSIIETQRPDAIFLDQALEEECGTMASLREVCPGLAAVPVFLLCPSAAEIPDEVFLHGGIHEVLRKPLEVAVLEEALERARRWSAVATFEWEQLLAALDTRLAASEGEEPTTRLAHEILLQARRVLPQTDGGLQALPTCQHLLEKLLDQEFLRRLDGAPSEPNPRELLDSRGLLADRETMSLPDLLQAVSGRGLSGVLTVESPSADVLLYLEAGMMVWARFCRISETFAATREIYCRHHRVPLEELIRRLAAGVEEPLAQLADENTFPAHCVADAVLETALEVLTACERDTASYTLCFESGVSVLPQRFEVAANTFLLKLASRADEWGLFEEVITTETSFIIVEKEIEHARLSAYEQHVLDAFGVTSLAGELPGVCRLSTFEVFSALYDLLRRKIIRSASQPAEVGVAESSFGGGRG